MRTRTQSGPTARVSIVALVVLAALALPGLSGIAVAVSATALPGSAGFYRYPSPGTLASALNGQVFATEPMTVTEPLQHVSSHAIRIMYRSQGVNWEPVAVTGFLLIPRGQAPRGGWPVVAWAHGTAGVGPDCAPSRSPNLYLPGLDAYQGLITRLLSDGFAVVGTDYPGLGFPGQLHPYIQQGAEGRAVIDSVIAARHLVPQLSRSWFAVGHSQGGQAALATGERALRAPDLRFLGTVSIAPANHISLIVRNFGSLPPSSGFIFNLAGTYASYVAVSARLFAPGLRYTDLLSPQLAAEIPVAKRLCILDMALHLQSLHPPLRSIVNPDWPSSPQLRQFFASAEPATRRSAGPILLLQGDLDAAVPIQTTTLLFGELCRLGNAVQYRTFPSADHDTILSQGYPTLVQWLRDRLSGSPVTAGGAACVPSGAPAAGGGGMAGAADPGLAGAGGAVILAGVVLGLGVGFGRRRQEGIRDD